MLVITVLALLFSNSATSDEIAIGISSEPPSEIPSETPGEITVVAKSRKCTLSRAGASTGASAGRTLRNADFKRYAAEWAAGRPVRIVVPQAARTRCLAKIMFKLHDHGVTQAEFVDMPAAIPAAIPAAMPGAAVVETVPVKAN